MGQGKSKYSNERLYDPSDYNEVQSLNDERYGFMKLLVNKATQYKYAEISKTLNDESIMDNRL